MTKKIDKQVYQSFYKSYKKMCEENREKPIPFSEFKEIFDDIIKKGEKN